jgi:hypothetical protein
MDILESLNNIPDGLNIANKFVRDRINVAKLVTGDKTAFVYLDDNTNRQIDTTSEATRTEPLIAYKGDRNNIYITGPSGAGKSIIAAEFAKQYKALNPHNKVFYCCSTDLRDDRTWGELDFVSALDVNKIYSEDMEQEEEREMIRTLFANSLIVFDDLDMLPAAKKKIMTRFQGKIVEVGRKYEISCIIVSHIVCGGVNTKMVLNEANIYITFRGMIKGNRLLKHYKGFSDDQLAEHATKTSSWIAYNFRYNTIITPRWIKRM